MFEHVGHGYTMGIKNMVSVLISLVMCLWRIAEFGAMWMRSGGCGRKIAVAVLALMPFAIGTVPYILYFERDQTDNLRQMGFANVEYDEQAQTILRWSLIAIIFFYLFYIIVQSMTTKTQS